MPIVRMLGSSPRGRGKPSCSRSVSAQRGLIPAWAGKTSKLQAALNREAAHPRVGGENSATVAKTGSYAGSSPRGRGKLSEMDRTVLATGLIPAWAGKT